jgi:hypothetical protein
MTLARDIALLAFGMLPSIAPTSNFQEGLLVFVISGFWLFVTCYGSIGGHKSTKSLSGKRLN